MCDFWKWVTQAIVVVVGWIVVHRLSSERDRDKSRREMVAKSADQLIDALSAHLAAAHEYHVNARDRAAELKIKMAIQDMAMRATGLSDLASDMDTLAQCRSEIANVRRATTGSHFEDEHNEPIDESSEQVQTIAEAVLRAKRALLKLKHRQFPAL